MNNTYKNGGSMNERCNWQSFDAVFGYNADDMESDDPIAAFILRQWAAYR